MRLLIDTCSWLKLGRLQDKKKFDAKKLYNWADIQITHDVEKELEYWRCLVWEKEKTQILPINNEKIFREAIILGFDDADASILSNGNNDPDFFIVSEDGAIIKFSKLSNFSTIQLSDLFRILSRMKLINRTEMYHLAKYLRKLRNITKKKYKSLKNWIVQT